MLQPICIRARNVSTFIIALMIALVGFSSQQQPGSFRNYDNFQQPLLYRTSNDNTPILNNNNNNDNFYRQSRLLDPQPLQSTQEQQQMCGNNANSNAMSIVSAAISASAAATAAAASALVTITSSQQQHQRLSSNNNNNGASSQILLTQPSDAGADCKSAEVSNLLSTAASAVLAAAQALSSASNALNGYAAAHAAQNAQATKLDADFVVTTTTTTEAPTTTTEILFQTESRTTPRTITTAATANDDNFALRPSQSLGSLPAPAPTGVQLNPLAFLFSLLWTPPVFSTGPIYIDKCVGCQILSDALNPIYTQNIDNLTACRGYIEANLEEPLRPLQLRAKGEELRKKNPSDPTFALLECCHQKFAVQFFGSAQAATFSFPDPPGLTQGKTCSDMIVALVKLVKGDYPKSGEVRWKNK